MRNHEYWVKKDQMKVTARQHTDEMYTNYAAEITDRINRTMLYDNSNMATRISGGRMPVCEVVPLDVVSAILNEKDSPKMCVLNFASFKNPGGMFLEGSIAQEECLCHGSYLYNVLSNERLRPAYEYNRTCLNRSMYQNHAFYTPDVRFFKDNTRRLCAVTKEENSRILRSRISFVLNVMAAQNVSCPILGAYGCGVFGQDPTEVAQIFKEELTSGAYPFERAVFAIIPSDTKTLDAFKNVFEQR